MRQGAGGRKWPSDEEFSDAVSRSQIYPRRNIVRYLLDHLESAFGHKERADLASASIEHVLPQTLSPAWKQALGATADEQANLWRDTLGNLTLTGYNPELSNAPFAEKQAILSQSHYELNRWIVEQAAWGPSEIEARGNALAKMALKRWRR
jgi:hypothetical protein